MSKEHDFEHATYERCVSQLLVILKRLSGVATSDKREHFKLSRSQDTEERLKQSNS